MDSACHVDAETRRSGANGGVQARGLVQEHGHGRARSARARCFGWQYRPLLRARWFDADAAVFVDGGTDAHRSLPLNRTECLTLALSDDGYRA